MKSKSSNPNLLDSCVMQIKLGADAQTIEFLAEPAKYVMMASVNLVNCIARAP